MIGRTRTRSEVRFDCMDEVELKISLVAGEVHIFDTSFVILRLRNLCVRNAEILDRYQNEMNIINTISNTTHTTLGSSDTMLRQRY